MKAAKSKTILFSALLAGFGVLQESSEVLEPLFGPYGGVLSMAIAAIVAALRVVTTAPLSEK